MDYVTDVSRIITFQNTSDYWQKRISRIFIMLFTMSCMYYSNSLTNSTQLLLKKENEKYNRSEHVIIENTRDIIQI